MKIVLIVLVSLCLIFVCVFPVALCTVIDGEDVLLCGNSDCTEPVSRATALLSYRPDMEDKVAVKRGDPKQVYGKLPKKKLFLVRHGKTKKLGFVASELLTEIRVLKKTSALIEVPAKKIFPHLVKTEPTLQHVPGGVAAEAGNQTPASTPYYVTNGTTITYGMDGEPIEPTATEEPSVKATESPNKENIVKKVDEHDDDDEEDDDDEAEEEDGEEEEEEEEPSKEQLQASPIVPTKTEKSQAEFQTFLSDALNAEPGKNSEADDQILNMFGGSTQPIPGANQQASFSNSQSVSDTPSLNQVPEVLSAAGSQVSNQKEVSPTVVSSNQVPEGALPTVAPPNQVPGEASQTVISSNQTPEVPPVSASASVQVPEASPAAASPTPEVQVTAFLSNHQPVVASQSVNLANQTPGVPLAAVYPPNQFPEVPPTTAFPSNQVPHIASENVIPPNQAHEVPPTTAYPPPNEVPPATEFPPNQPTEVPPTTGIPPNLPTEVPPTTEFPPNQPTEVPPTTGIPPNLPTEVPPTAEFPSNQQPAAAAQPVIPPNQAHEIPTMAAYSPDPTPEVLSVAELPPQVASQTTPPQPQFSENLETATQDATLYSLNDTDHISDDPVNATSENEAPREAVPTPPPPPLPIRPMYPGLIGMPAIHNPIPPQPGYPEALQETRHESVQAVVPETAQEPAVPQSPEQPVDQNLPEATQPEVENSSSEPHEIESNVQIPVANIQEPEIPTTDTESPGFFGFFTNPFAGLFSNQPAENQPEIIPDSQPEIMTESQPSVIPDGDCKTEALLETSCDDAPTSQDILHLFDKTVPENSYVSLYLLSTSITVLLFLLGYYFLERTRQDGPLVAKVNQLTHQLQVATAQQDIKNFDDSRSIEMNAAFMEAQEELNELKKIKADLEAQLESQQQELEATTEAGLEMNRMLSDLLAQRNASDTLLKSVEHLQGQLNAQQQVIDGMNKSLTEKKEENEALQVELAAAQAKTDNLEEELNDMRNNLNVLLKEKETVMFDMEKTNMELQLELAALKDGRRTEAFTLNQAVADLKEKLKIRNSEYLALKQTVDDLRTRGGVDVDALYDVGNVRAELVRALTEKEELQERFGEEVGARKLLEDHVKAVDNEVHSLRLSFETAEKEKLEAETKLTVLSNYFKEKENQLHKELGLQEAMWAQKQGDETTIFETIKSLKDEVENYKAQNDTLKKEIIDQERGLKGQIATLEKKAHENWVAARQAERRLEESKQEAGQLRNMLTLMEKSTVPDSDAKTGVRELNGEDILPPFLTDGSSPLPLPPLPLDPSLLPPGFMHPFLPPGFMPPPPPSHPGEHRPPPLGRMSSPPLNRYSPAPGDFNFDRMSPRPPVRSYRSPPIDPERFHHLPPPPWDDRSSFRPVANQRESRHDYPDSNPSSRPSSAGSLEKPSRRSQV